VEIMAVIHTNKENKEFSPTVVTGEDRDILLSKLSQNDNTSEESFVKALERSRRLLRAE